MSPQTPAASAVRSLMVATSPYMACRGEARATLSSQRSSA